jgi:hypothetical protein
MKVRRIDRDVLVEPVIGHQSILRNRIARDHLHFRGRENAIPNSARLGVFAAPGSLSLSCTVIRDQCETVQLTILRCRTTSRKAGQRCRFLSTAVMPR